MLWCVIPKCEQKKEANNINKQYFMLVYISIQRDGDLYQKMFTFVYNNNNNRIGQKYIKCACAVFCVCTISADLLAAHRYCSTMGLHQ